MILFGVFVEEKGKFKDWNKWDSEHVTALLSMNAAAIVKTMMVRSYPELHTVIKPLKIEYFSENRIRKVKLRNVDYYSNCKLCVYPLLVDEIIPSLD